MPGNNGAVAQLGERRLCKPDAVGSIPISSTGGSFTGQLLCLAVEGSE